MTDLEQLIKSQGLKLVPFFNSLLVYYAFVRDPIGDLWSTILKCAPIVFLMMYIYLKGFELTNEYKCSQRILVGLIFSCIGDALLNIDLFPHGMGAFAIAQICYISTFGWTPLKLYIGIPLYLAGAAMVGILYNKLDDVLVIGLPIYAILLLMTSLWRSIVKAMHKKDALNIFCAVGVGSFVLSDGLIAINMFLIQVPHARIWIMTTYYFAQFAITLSTANESKVAKKSPKKSKQSIQSRINGSDHVRRRNKI